MERSKSASHPENLKILKILLQTDFTPAPHAISQSLPQFPLTIFGLFPLMYTPLPVVVDARTDLAERPLRPVQRPVARHVAE